LRVTFTTIDLHSPGLIEPLQHLSDMILARNRGIVYVVDAYRQDPMGSLDSHCLFSHIRHHQPRSNFHCHPPLLLSSCIAPSDKKNHRVSELKKMHSAESDEFLAVNFNRFMSTSHPCIGNDSSFSQSATTSHFFVYLTFDSPGDNAWGHQCIKNSSHWNHRQSLRIITPPT